MNGRGRRAELPFAKQPSRKDELGLASSEDFLELARSMHALLRAETVSHDALSKRVGELEGALAAATEEILDLRQRNSRLSNQLSRVGQLQLEG